MFRRRVQPIEVAVVVEVQTVFVVFSYSIPAGEPGPGQGNCSARYFAPRLALPMTGARV